MDLKDITRSDAIFFMDMINSVWSPNFEPGFYKLRPYHNLLKERDSEDSKRFVGIYKAIRHTLTEREQTVLNEMYGVYKEKSQLKTVASMLSISPERVRQISRKAENKIARELLSKLKEEIN